MFTRRIYFIYILTAGYCVPMFITIRLEWHKKQIGTEEFNNKTLLFPSNFPSPVSGNTTSVPTLNDKDCLAESGWIYYNRICSRLLSNLACKENQWLVINQEGLPYCKERPCPFGELFFETKCVDISTDTVCGVSELLYVEFTGEAYCDCSEDFIYVHSMRKCVAEHRQGPCPSGMILEIKRNQIICIHNKCPTDDLIFNYKDGQCYKKTFEGACSQKGSSVLFDKSSNIASCASITDKNIFLVPSKMCKKGLKRNYDNKCKKIFQTARSSDYKIPSTSPLLSNRCPFPFRRAPNGFCTRNRQ